MCVRMCVCASECLMSVCVCVGGGGGGGGGEMGSILNCEWVYFILLLSIHQRSNATYISMYMYVQCKLMYLARSMSLSISELAELKYSLAALNTRSHDTSYGR